MNRKNIIRAKYKKQSVEEENIDFIRNKKQNPSRTFDRKTWQKIS